SGHNVEHVGVVPAAALIERNWLLRDIERAAAEAFFHVNKNVDKVPVIGNHGFRSVRAFAGGILVHVDFDGRWGGSFKLDGAGYSGSRRGVDGCGGWSTRRRGGWLLRCFFLLAAASEKYQCK